MHSVSFGNSTLLYSIRLSPKAEKKRIEITPYSIEVIAPESSGDAEIRAFMEEKAKDVFIAQEKLKAKNQSFLHERDQFFSGGKISFRGRRLAVVVTPSDVTEPSVTYRSRFYITVPLSVPEDRRSSVAQGAVEEWLELRLASDSKEIADGLGKRHGLGFKAIRVRDQKHIWATCGHDEVLYINRLLIKVPRKVLEYVVAHELAHLKHRNHSEAFWALVGEMVPEYKALQDLLDSW